VTWVGATEHDALLSTAECLVDELRGLRGRLQHANDTEYAQHSDFANRARSLADYLNAAILLTRADAYAPAFANLRTALEHVLVDHLIFLGQRYIQIIIGVDAATWADWQRQRSSGEAFTQALDWRRRRDTVEITYEGLRSEPDSDGESYILSPYYFLMKQYQPYWGPANAQAQFNSGLSDEEGERRFADENTLIYHTYLNWPSIKRSLLSNDFADETTIAKLEVHYRFLSAFVHPISDRTADIYGRNAFAIPIYDHYSSELALLYTVAFAVKEIRDFREMTQRYPSVGVSGWEATESLCLEAWNKISYLWFPGHPPHQFDRIQEANKRAFRSFKTTGASAQQVQDPASIPDDEVGYYRNPIGRLVSLHSDSQELTTGFCFKSPWQRNDARFR